MPPRDLQTVLITGASTGVGLALGRLLLKTDYRVILTARETSLHRFAKEGVRETERVRLRALDVTNETERRMVVEEAGDEWGGIDVLINNAGVAYRSVVEHVTEQERLAQMNVNFRSPMELVRLVLPSMRKKRRGRIINVSSVAGMMAMPTMAVYAASKFALEGATEALWYEVRPWGIKVTLVQPGFVHSDAFSHVRLTRMSRRASRSPDEPYYHHYEHMGPFIERMMRLAVATPETVARKILKTMRRANPPLRVPATIDAILFSMLRRVLPRSLYHYVLYRALPSTREWGSGRCPAESGSELLEPTVSKNPSPWRARLTVTNKR